MTSTMDFNASYNVEIIVEVQTQKPLKIAPILGNPLLYSRKIIGVFTFEFDA